MDFGKKLGILREKKGWSQYEVATKLGIKRPRYNAWEQGIANPRADMMAKIAELFEVQTDDLLGVPMYDGPESSVEEGFPDTDFDDADVRMVARSYKKLTPENRELFKNLLEQLKEK